MPSLSGTTSVTVVNGTAAFTRLRVDQEVKDIRLIFSVSTGTLSSAITVSGGCCFAPCFHTPTFLKW